jgi:hypothetical protein
MDGGHRSAATTAQHQSSSVRDRGSQSAKQPKAEMEHQTFKAKAARGNTTACEGHLQRWLGSLGFEVQGNDLGEACKSGVLLIDLIEHLDQRHKFRSVNRKVSMMYCLSLSVSSSA